MPGRRNERPGIRITRDERPRNGRSSRRSADRGNEQHPNPTRIAWKPADPGARRHGAEPGFLQSDAGAAARSAGSRKAIIGHRQQSTANATWLGVFAAAMSEIKQNRDQVSGQERQCAALWLASSSVERSNASTAVISQPSRPRALSAAQIVSRPTLPPSRRSTAGLMVC